MLGYINPEALDKTIKAAKSPSSRALNSDYGPKAKRRQFPQRSKYCAGLRQRHATGTGESYRPTCHKGTSSCFGDTAHQWLFLYQLEQLLTERKSADPETSYTAKLYASGTNALRRKWAKKA